MLYLVMRDYGFRYQVCRGESYAEASHGRALLTFYVPSRWLRDRLARYWRRHYEGR